LENKQNPKETSNVRQPKPIKDKAPKEDS